MKKLMFSILVLFLLMSSISYGQFKDYQVKGGFSFAPTMPFSEFSYDGFPFLARGFFGFEINRLFSLELGVGFGKYVTKDDYSPGGFDQRVSANIIPIDIRGRIYPFISKSINPYIFLGGGPMYYEVKEVPILNALNYGQYVERSKGWAGLVEGGIGMEIKLANQVLFDINAGVSYTFTDVLNNFNNKPFQDTYAHLGVGFTFTGKKGKDDSDNDGLTDAYEEQIGTNPENPDTDGDGLNDGQEVNSYKTNPLVKDSDNDGLNDKEEVMTYMTNPTNPDTDGDGLNDGVEVFTHKTSPTNPDTDGDKLSDGDEILKYKTDPLNADSDGEGLNDGDEVLVYKTNPLNKDTDGGSVNDFTEVKRGTNPLDGKDDIVKEKIEVGKVIILEGINFETNSAVISSGSEEILMSALKTMKDNPEIIVEISGHTDSRGTRAKNEKLSLGRANSVKEWLVANGVSPDRIETIGYGPDKPIAPNDSEENMYKNRRIEFKRVK